jgi:hypothetical protein
MHNVQRGDDPEIKRCLVNWLQANTELADSSPWHMKVDTPARLTSPGFMIA